MNKLGQTKKLLKLLNASSCCDCPPISEAEGNILECRTDGLYAEAGVGSVQSVIGVDTNGFDFTITDPTSNPSITLGITAPADAILFGGGSGAIASDSTNFVFKDATNRLGIRTNAPGSALHVTSSGEAYTAQFIQTDQQFCNVFIQNSNAGVNAAAGIRLGNNNGLGAQIAMVSSASSAFGGAEAMLFHNIRGKARICSDIGVDLSTGTTSSGTAQTKLTVDSQGRVAIGSNPTPNANAILDLQSTTRAFMPPRMTTTQKNAIASPTAGMVVYDSDLGKLCLYTTAWETVTSV